MTIVDSDYALLLPFDGPEPYTQNFAVNTNSEHTVELTTRRKSPTLQYGGVIGRPGRFGKAAQVAEAGTNLIHNPSFETGTAGWLATNGTVSQSATLACIGDYSAMVTAAGGSDVRLQTTPLAQIAVTPGLPYTLNVYLGSSTTIAMRPAILWYTAALGFISINYGVFAASQNKLSPFTITATAPATAAYAYVYALLAQSVPSAGDKFYIDCVHFEQSGYRKLYLDGSLGDGHAWTGAAHASTSTRAAARLAYQLNGVTLAGGSVATWVYMDSISPNYPRIFRASMTSYPDYAYIILYANTNSTTIHEANIFVNVNGTSFSFGNYTGTLYGWHHFAVTWESGEIILYIDGSPYASSASFPSSSLELESISVGCDLTDRTTDRSLNGFLDDFAVFNRVLTTDEIAGIYNAGEPLDLPVDTQETFDIGDVDALFPYDGGTPYTTDFTVSTSSAAKGISPTVATGAIIGRPSKYEKGVQVAEGTTNLVLSPSFETGTAISSATSALSAQSTDVSLYGDYSLRVYPLNNTAQITFENNTSGITPGSAYTATIHFMYFGTQDVRLRLNVLWYNVGTLLATHQYTFEAQENGRWLARHGSGTIPATSNIFRFKIEFIDDPAGSVYYFDAFQLEQKAYATPYCDGSLGTGHTWSGTAHDSTSTRSLAYLGYPSSAINPESFTISMWAKYGPTTGTSMFAFLHFLAPGNRIYLYSTGTTFYYLLNTTGFPGPAVDTEWHHHVMAYDGTTVTVYFDGAYVNAALVSPVTLGSRIYVGSNGNLNQINGLIDDLLILDYALDAETVAAIYNASLPVGITYPGRIEDIIRRLPTTETLSQEFSVLVGNQFSEQDAVDSLDLSSTDLNSYSHKSILDGGYDTMSLSFNIGYEEIGYWLNALGRRIRSEAPYGVMWSGFINDISISVGELTIVRGGLKDIANVLTAAYRTVRYDTNPPIGGVSRVTPSTSNPQSINRYGTFEKQLSAGTAQDADALQLRDLYLIENGNPATSQSLSIGGNAATEFTVTLNCLGFKHMLEQYTYSNRTGTTAELSVIIGNVLDADPNALFSNRFIAPNTYTAKDYYEEQTGLSVVQELVSVGDNDDNRYRFAIQRDDVFVYEKIAQSLTYMYDAGQGGQVTLSNGVEFPLGLVQPGYYLLVSGLPVIGGPAVFDGSDPRVMLIDSVSFTAPNSLQLTGNPLSRVEMRLARLGLKYG